MPFKLCFLSHLLAEYVPLNGQQASLSVPLVFAATGPKTSKSEHESLQIRATEIAATTFRKLTRLRGARRKLAAFPCAA